MALADGFHPLGLGFRDEVEDTQTRLAALLEIFPGPEIVNAVGSTARRPHSALRHAVDDLDSILVRQCGVRLTQKASLLEFATKVCQRAAPSTTQAAVLQHIKRMRRRRGRGS